MELNEAKSVIKSKTIWGILIALIGLIGSKFGVSVSESEVQGTVDIVFNILEGFGLLIATYGRVKATKVIK